MTNIIPDAESLDPAYVRAQLDEILAGEIISFIKIDSDSALISYNLATIACIVIAVERESELADDDGMSCERFTKKSFIKELADIGLGDEKSIEKDVDSVIDKGYISIGPDGKLKAEVSAYTTAGFLDTMFPGMPGMNLVAFIMQMNDEVNSGRKSLEEAKSSFLQTLKSRGVAVTKAKLEKISSKSDVKKRPDPRFKTAAAELKKANALRISKLRLKQSSKKPSFYSSNGYVSDNVKVKSVFAKGPGEEEIKLKKEAEKAAMEKKLMDEKLKAQELAEKEKRIKEAEKAAEEARRKAEELARREKELEEAKKAAEEAKKKALELKRQEAEKATAMQARLAALEEKLKAAEEERSRMGKDASDRLPSDDNLSPADNLASGAAEKNKSDKNTHQSDDSDDDDIEARIAAFESELAMPCPLCKDGKVISEKTPAGKEYYTCSNKECRFVSWAKPWHFECPQCKNSYLVEFITPSGEKGLKCPRAACSYTQDNLLDPVQNLALQAKKVMPKKKKRVVRRVRRRR